MKPRFEAFLKEDKGAITVDWVMLTALVIVLCIALIAAIGPTLNTQGTEIVDRANISTGF